jgi:hypothetical protein
MSLVKTTVFNFCTVGKTSYTYNRMFIKSLLIYLSSIYSGWQQEVKNLKDEFILTEGRHVISLRHPNLRKEEAMYKKPEIKKHQELSQVTFSSH